VTPPRRKSRDKRVPTEMRGKTFLDLHVPEEGRKEKTPLKPENSGDNRIVEQVKRVNTSKRRLEEEWSRQEEGIKSPLGGKPQGGKRSTT